jgi:DNA-binding transcriptional LysR family regulator
MDKASCAMLIMEVGNMSILQLEYFKALAETSHLTKTANNLFIAVPSLSASIARLEKEVGCKLFDRDGRNMQLNKSGEIYLKYTNEILLQLENAKKEARDIANMAENSISIGISSPVVWLDAMRLFIRENPGIKVSHTLLKHDRFKDCSYCAKFDFIITAVTDLPDSRWEYKQLIADDKPVIAVYPSHPFAKRKSLRLNETKDENYIAVSRDFSMRKFFEDSCQMSGFTPRIVLECDYILRSSMLAAEHGIVFTTASGAQARMFPQAAYIPVEDPPIRRTQGIFWQRQRYLSKNALLFRDFIVDYYQKLDI